MMKEDGGQAFPQPVTVGPNDDLYPAYPGMVLRDWFAGQALVGMMAQSHGGPKDWTHMGHGWGEDAVNHLNKHETHVAHSVAGFAYQIADALLAARQEQPR